tara:strand:- start:4728 stop:6704 length:1977 start_codon:yes stop_codon:yes gene_type:complete
MAKNTVEIQFKGDSKNLTNAIDKLDKATKRLLSTQTSIKAHSERVVRANNSNRRSIEKLRVQLQLQGKNLKDLNIPLSMYKKALNGNQLALARIQLASKKYIKTLKRKRKGLLDTEHGTRILGGSFAVLRSKMLLASFGASLFGASIGRLTALLGEQEKAEKKLETAIGRHSKALLTFASEQQKVTTFGDEELINAMSLVGAYTDNEQAIARLTTASMDLATAKGMDLTSAVDLVSKSVFSSTNALSRYGIEINGSQGSVQRLISATQAISKLYEGQARASAETFLGSVTQLSNSVGDLGERFGLVLAPSVMAGAKALKLFAESIDTEEIKAYGTALLGTAGVYVIFTKGTALATAGMKLFNKTSAKNIAILAGMLAIGAVIDKLNLFKEMTGASSEELEKLNQEIENFNVKSSVSESQAKKRLEAELQLQIAEKNMSDLQKEKFLIEKERIALNQKFTVAIDGQEPFIQKSIDFQIEDIKLRTRQIILERALADAKVAGTSQLLGSLVQLNNASAGSAKVSARLAQAQAIIDTYAGANKAFAQGGVLGFITGSAIIAQGLANVAVISKNIGDMNKFEEGGLVGGKRHSQGGTIIEAERGEFVMSRNAVQSIGVETLNQMNQGGGAGITLNISAPLVDETIVDTIIPAIEKATRMNLA